MLLAYYSSTGKAIDYLMITIVLNHGFVYVGVDGNGSSSNYLVGKVKATKGALVASWPIGQITGHS